MSSNKSFQDMQGFLSIGYIYLIVMGILNETLYYQQFGIDILKYSSILDVLISPISKITSSILSLATFLGLVVIVMTSPKYLAKRKDKKWFKKCFKFEEELDENQTKISLLKMFSFMFALAIMGFYVGTGLGKGYKTAQNIENGDITYSDKITFINGEADSVKILGSNSAYIFYLVEGNKTTQITPINGVVQKIEDNKTIKKQTDS